MNEDQFFAIIGRKQVALEQAYRERQNLLNILRQIASGELPGERVQVNGDSVTVLPE